MEYDIIPDRGSKNAKKALKLAVERGFDPSEVLTFRGGYYVPVEIEGENAIETIPGTENEPPVEIVVGDPEKTEDATPEEVEAEKPAGDEDETKEEAKADAETPAPKTTTPRKRAAKKE